MIKKNARGLVAESSGFALPFFEKGVYPKATITHVMRNPWAFARNVLFDGTSGFSTYLRRGLSANDIWRCSNLKSVKWGDMSPFTQTMRFFVEWNRRIEQLAETRKVWFHRVESSPASLLQKVPEARRVLDVGPTNSRLRTRLSNRELDKILSQFNGYQQFVEAAKHYGYTYYT